MDTQELIARAEAAFSNSHDPETSKFLRKTVHPQLGVELFVALRAEKKARERAEAELAAIRALKGGA